MTQLEQRLAGRGDPDAPADAVKDRLAELVLEDQNLPADRGLRDVQLLPGGSKGAGLSNGSNDFELPEIHESAYMCLAHESTLEDSSRESKRWSCDSRSHGGALAPVEVPRCEPASRLGSAKRSGG